MGYFASNSGLSEDFRACTSGSGTDEGALVWQQLPAAEHLPLYADQVATAATMTQVGQK